MADIKNHSTLGTSLAHYWDLQETSGTRYGLVGGVNLDDVNTVGSGTGKVGNCASFNEASSENLRTASAISSTYNGIGALSFNFWVKTSDTTNYNWMMLLHDGSALIGFQRYTTTWTFRVNTSTLVDSPAITASNLEDGNWHMVTGVYDGSKVRIYLDGTESGSGTSQTGNTSIGSSKLGFVARPYDDVGPMSADIDEVGLWTKALTSSEITDLYNFGNGLPYYDPADVKNDTTLSTSLTSYWELETDGTDSHGSNNLTASGSPSYTTGKNGNGVDLESGSSQYFYINDASQTGLDNQTNMSFSYWFKLESDTDPIILGKYATGSAGYWLQLQVSNNVKFQDTSEGDSCIIPVTDASNGTWYHDVVTYAGGVVKLYRNGVYIGTDTTSNSSIPNTTGYFSIGRVEKYNSNYFDGVLDEIAVWSKALTVAEVRALYGYGTPPVYNAGSSSSIKPPKSTLLLMGVG